MQRRSSPSIPWSSPEPTAYGSPLEHLADHINRISDLIAAHLARAPERAGLRRGLGRSELVIRASLRNADEVPDEARALDALAEQKAAWIAEREDKTLEDGTIELPPVRLVERFGLSAAERDALLLVAAPRIDPRYAVEWEDAPHEVMRHGSGVRTRRSGALVR